MSKIDHSREHLAAIVEGSDDAIITKDLNSIIKSWNGGAERLFGYSANEVIGQPITILFPEDRLDEEVDFIARLRRGERIANYETTRRRKDGSFVPISLTVSPVRDASGTVIGASKIARDITRQRQAEEQQQLLLAEMRHRVANSFAIASALLSISARQVDSVTELVPLMRDRLSALSTAHSLSMRNSSPAGDADRTTLSELLQSVLRAFADVNALNIEVEEVCLPGEAVTPLALIFYELATNAMKYGGLSHPGGKLEIRSERREHQLILLWKESFGPETRTAAEERSGFGSSMIDNTIRFYLNGDIERSLTDKNLSVILKLDPQKVAMPATLGAAERTPTG
ncbi:sensor histidine kinase [Pelagovum pacificum]|uniref:histidine kinase n=1 Tax=Pelagovum pacificum TaxID=2588711 RepID=A0A5C5G920_9RHOB|nr:PAS domain S-box protein [Pelagovum pacificum]QQA41490.1 PAS domain S-box protein [Pelagovum pacificum]TNY30510.1 PAS domain S-box protein [Pelagovum pacificum]